MNHKSQTSFDIPPRKTEKMYIYGLYAASDKTKRIMYVGKSKNPSSRLYGHVTMRKQSLLKSAWIKWLHDNGDDVGIRIIEVCTPADCDQKEVFWIRHYMKLNAEFKNSAQLKKDRLSPEKKSVDVTSPKGRINIRLKELAEKKGLNITDLSHETRATQVTIRAMWHNRPTQREQLIDKLCKILDCTPGDLLIYTPDDQSGSSSAKPTETPPTASTA